ncbi:MAG: glycosyltransferase family 39 protein [Bacteroidota bacterium]
MRAIKANLSWVVLIFLITYIPVWYNLDRPSLYIWDEASYAINSLEMAMSGNWSVLLRDGQPDLYNTKPPLVIWLQNICIHLFGPTELALRFPSALAALLTCLAVFFFAKKNLNRWVGILAVAFLTTSKGFIHHHVSRTGDLDSVLVFFITAYSLLFFDLLLNRGHKENLKLLLIGLGVFCAFMSKSVAGLMPVLGLFIGIFFIKNGKTIFHKKYLYLSSGLVLMACAAFYVYKGFVHPGYLEKVWLSEYARFTEVTMPWLVQPWYYYFKIMYIKIYSFYIILLPLTFILFFNKDKTVKNIFILCALFSGIYIFLISYPHVKLNWYLAPVFPFFSLMLGMFFYEILIYFRNYFRIKSILWKIAVPFCVLFFLIPYKNIYLQNADHLPREHQEREGYAIRKLSRSHPSFNSYKVLMPVEFPEHADPAKFYIKSLNYFKNYDLKLIGSMDDILEGDTVLCAQPYYTRRLKKRFKTITLAKVFETELMVFEKN